MITINTLEQLTSGQIHGCQRIDLACGLTTFPQQIFDHAETLEILNLSGNALRVLPDDLHRLTKLRILFCSGNQFTHLPPVLGRCANLSMIGFKSNQISEVPPDALPASLRWLILTDNQIEALPESIAACIHLQKLMLAGNQLSQLPKGLASCQKLQLLRISSNHLTSVPDELLSLPELAWLALAGNPCMNGSSPSSQIPTILWSELQIQHRLGEGASGQIYQAINTQGGRSDAVAVKLFKGQMTSDGLPKDEMAANLAMGTHPHLLAAIAQVKQHPEGLEGLVLPLLDQHFKNLAGPPSFESCTRDVYTTDVRYPLDTVISIATAIAQAMAHLHARGILHGDLYAHNILYRTMDDGTVDCMLGDFGAATLISGLDRHQQEMLNRLDVLAYAYLLEELLVRSDSDANISVVERLWEIQRCCVNPQTLDRPAFSAILDMLKSIGDIHSASVEI